MPPTERTRRINRFVLVIFVCAVFVALVSIISATMRSEKGVPAVSTAEHNALVLGELCNRYAMEHNQKYPARLYDLVPEYLSDVEYQNLQFRDFSGPLIGRKITIHGFAIYNSTMNYSARPAMEWTYVCPASSRIGNESVTISSPIPSNVEGRKMRVLVRLSDLLHLSSPVQPFMDEQQFQDATLERHEHFVYY